jgi:tetratricopeptide (TPR) repeat protein
MEDVALICDCLKNNKTDVARVLIEKTLKHDLKLYYYYLGLSCSTDKDYNKAILFFNASINNGLNNFLLSYNLGVAHLGKKDYDRAEKYFNYCIEQNNEYVNAYINLAYIYMKKGDLKRAYRVIKTAESVCNDDRILDIEKKLLNSLLSNIKI